MGLKEDLAALPAELVASRNDVAIAEALSVGRKKVVYTEVGKGKIIGAIGLEAANAVLDVIDTQPAYRHVKQLVENGWLDIGSPLARYAIDSMVPSVIPQEQADAIKSLAEVDDPVPVSAVSEILNNG